MVLNPQHPTIGARCGSIYLDLLILILSGHFYKLLLYKLHYVKLKTERIGIIGYCTRTCFELCTVLYLVVFYRLVFLIFVF
jgi:hypothetical protein